VQPQAVSPQLTQRIEAVKQSAYDFAGVSRLAASAKKPAGIESAVALREYNDQTTERFAIQEQAYEQWYLDVVTLMLAWAKWMHEEHEAGRYDHDAPTVSYRTRYLNKQIRWKDVDMADVEVQIQAASSLSRTLAGRYQTVIEWAQAGVITQDEARMLMQHPDLERVLSLYNAAMEDIERCIEVVLDGEILTPEPYQNLKMGVWRFQMAYLKALNDGAPEEILEGLRTWIVQAAHILGGPQQPGPMPLQGPGAEALGAPGAAPPGVVPGAGPMMPAPVAPMAALAPEAMMLTPQ
jgi:hypothetical protein